MWLLQAHERLFASLPRPKLRSIAPDWRQAVTIADTMIAPDVWLPVCVSC